MHRDIQRHAQCERLVAADYRGRSEPSFLDSGASALRVPAAAAGMCLGVLVYVLALAVRETEVAAEFFDLHAVTSVRLPGSLILA